MKLWRLHEPAAAEAALKRWTTCQQQCRPRKSWKFRWSGQRGEVVFFHSSTRCTSFHTGVTQARNGDTTPTFRASSIKTIEKTAADAGCFLNSQAGGMEVPPVSGRARSSAHHCVYAPVCLAHVCHHCKPLEIRSLTHLRSTARSQDILERLNLRPAARAQLTPEVI